MFVVMRHLRAGAAARRFSPFAPSAFDGALQPVYRCPTAGFRVLRPAPAQSVRRGANRRPSIFFEAPSTRTAGRRAGVASLMLAIFRHAYARHLGALRGHNGYPEMSDHEPLGITFDEAMEGWLGAGCVDPVEGRMLGQRQGTSIRIQARITIADLRRFIEQPGHAARLEGTVSFGPLGGELPIHDGKLDVLVVDPGTGARQMIYEAGFTAGGERFFLRGVKQIVDDPGLDVLEDMTSLFAVVHRGGDERGPIYGAGQLFFELLDAPKLLASMKVTGKTRLGQGLSAKLSFLSFAYGVLRDEYLSQVNPLYDAAYQNVVLRGQARDSSGAAHPFFLVSGIHSRGFPWGDEESFCDVMLVVGDPGSGPGRFAIARRRLEAHEVDVQGGSLSYDGPIFDLSERGTISFSEMHQGMPPVAIGRAVLSIRFRAAAHPLAPFPFRYNHEIVDRLSHRLRETLRRTLPSEHQMGFQIVPSSVSQVSGSIALQLPGKTLTLTIDAAETAGEAEDTTIRNIREPTLLYGYICAIRRAAGAARVQLHASSLRDDREHWGKDRLDALVGAVVSRSTSKDLDIQPGGVRVTDLAEPEVGGEGARLFQKLGDPLLQVTLDHFPTAVFHRRIITVRDPSGEQCPALEEAMETLRRESIDCPREVVVAAIRHDDKHEALARALEQSAFLATVEARRAATGKARADFAIVIKPSFMFAYNRRDRTTYTDPELVEHLVTRLRAEGYRRIAVVEAQSTYGEYFDHRGVRDVAAYLGYATDGSRGYAVVDLTEDEQEMRHLGVALGHHPVPVSWRDADFRISFAKNKTHCYVFYTLTLKNVYGALSLADKFKEYHCDRGIAATTVEYLAAFPVHFGIIDAWSSADGPFGIFADPEPNDTRTIIAGADLVAVDWVGASKMGIDPMLGSHMKLAVRAFGKPRIELVGDGSIYQPWSNVPMGLSLLATFGLDANHYFGNLLYMSVAYMDEQAFPIKSRSRLLHAVRQVTRPLSEAVFLQSGGQRTRANRALSRLVTWLGTEPQRSEA
jgi:uncharacterized protein (DUF362 family)